jgi:protein disulfide-isomerase A1
MSAVVVPRSCSSSFRRRWCRIFFLLLVLLLLTTLVASEIQRESAAAAADEEDVEDEDLEDLEDLEDEEEGSSGTAAPVFGRALLMDINDRTVDKVLGSHEYVFLLGYAPWCTRSSALMEDFALVSRLLAESGSTVVFAKLDAINNPSTASQYSIKGFPALLFFTNGTFQRYTSGHSRFGCFSFFLSLSQG